MTTIEIAPASLKLSKKDARRATNLLGALAAARDAEQTAKNTGAQVRDELLALAGDAEVVLDEDGIALYTADTRTRRSVKVEDFLAHVVAKHPEFERLVNRSTFRAVSRAKNLVSR